MADQSTAEELVSVLIEIDNYENLYQIIDLFFSKWPLSIYLGEVKIKQFLEDGKFHSAQKLTQELISIEDNWTHGMYLFGLSALNSKPSEFPYSDPSLIANPHIREEAIRNFSNWQSIKNDILFQIMHFELDNNNKLANYEKLLASGSNFGAEHHWRLLLGISLAAIDNKKFDVAIKYLLELKKQSPNFRIARKIIIEAFAKLHLPSEAINFLSEDFETNDVSVEDLLSYSEKLHVHQEYFEFLEKRYRESSFVKFKIAIAWCHFLGENFHEAESALNISEQSENCQGIEMLCIADIYQRINSPQNSKRILTNYLSTQKGMQTSDVVFAASLFSRLGEIEKALNLINLGDQDNQLIHWIKIILSKKLGEINTANELLDEYFTKFTNPFHINDLRNNLRLELNEDWIPTTKVISEVLLDVKTQSGNLASCFEILKVYLRSEMDPRIFLSAYMPLAQILGEKVEIPHEIKSDDPLVGHAVLHTSEVKSAEILASSDETKNELIRLALQSRLLIRNLNVLEGRRIYHEIKEMLFVGENGSVKSPKFRSLVEIYYLIQTALENGDFNTALSISKSALGQKQIYYGFAEQYLKALAASLTINKIFRHVKINQRLIPIEENDSMLDELASVFQEEEGIENLIGNSRRSRRGDEKILNKDISQILSNTQFSYLADVNKALLLAQESLEEARQLLLELIEKGEDYPEVHIALALINFEMKDFSGAYSAVSIAIDHWPDEYQWQVFAGNICEKMGNYHLAAKHYVEAQTINSEIEDLENLHKKVQNENALPDISKLITKGEELISQGRFQKS